MATRKTLTPISAFLLTAAIAHSASAGDLYTLHEHRTSGQSLTYVFTQHSRDKSTFTNNNVPGVTDTSTAQYWKITETILSAADGSPTQARVDFDPASVDTSQDVGQAEKKTPPPYAAKSVTLSFKPDGSITSDFPGDAGFDDESLLEGILSGDQDNFPDKPVAVGESWDNSVKLSQKIVGFNPKDHYSATYHLDSVNPIGSKQIAQISYTNIFSYHSDGDKKTGAIEADTVDKTTGTMLVDIAAGLIVKNDNKETTKATSPPTWPDKLDDLKEQTYHAEIVTDATVWPPAVPVAAAPPPAPVPLPQPMLDQLPAGRIALRVLSPELQPLHIDEIDGIYVIRPNSTFKMGLATNPPTAMVLGHLPDGSVALDSQMFEDARTIPNFRNVQRMVVVFRCNDVPMRVAGPFPADLAQPIILIALADPQGCGFDPDHGPIPAATDETAGQVVDSQGHPSRARRERRTDRIEATRGADGSYVLVFDGSGRPFDLKLGELTGSKLTAWWYSPRDGTAKPIGTIDKADSHQFTPPSSGEDNDWVLVLDDAAKNFPTPGEAFKQ